jgi:DNA-3-methyladenine glycosylase I
MKDGPIVPGGALVGAEGFRCPWAESHPLYVAYHDAEWGIPLRDDRRLFELLILEGFQAGLSWLLILKRREALREAFEGFDPGRLAAWGDDRIETALGAPGVIRNRRKVEAVRKNARACLDLTGRGIRLSELLWSFVGGKQEVHGFHVGEVLPCESDASRAMSRSLKGEGFSFVGATICYAFMQAAGLVDDHYLECFRHSSRRNASREVGGTGDSPAGETPERRGES